MSQIYNNAVSADQEKILHLLAETKLGVLTGGTALALQIGHRKSYDLDFVTQQEVTSAYVDAIKKKLGPYALTQLLKSDTQYTTLADEIKITLFQDPVKTLHPTVLFNKTELVSVQDIFATKLYILGRRATWRDYCDIAVCLDQNIATLAQGIQEATQRYQVAQRWILEPMTYFDDIEMMPIEWLNKEYADDEIKQILHTEAEKYVSNSQ